MRKQMNKLNGYDSREAMWEFIRQWAGKFTVRDIYLATTLDASSVRAYLRGLTNGGYLAEDTSTAPSSFTLVNDCGIDAPRVRKDGSRVTQGQGRINMWRTMRTLKVFSSRDLAIHASTHSCQVKESSAVDYCKHLCRAGYLRKDRHGNYFFLPHMFTGPKPPMIQRVKRVWDQNLKKIMWSEDND